LKALTKDIYFRVSEKKQRPKKLDHFNEVLNASSYFFISAQNLTSENGTKPYTAVEVSSLGKLIESSKVIFV
jgi:hypothetical protein